MAESAHPFGKPNRPSVMAVFKDQKKAFINAVKGMQKPTTPLEAVNFWLEIITYCSKNAASTYDSLEYEWEGPQEIATGTIYDEEMKGYLLDLHMLASPEYVSDAVQNWQEHLDRAVSHFQKILRVIFDARPDKPESDQDAQNGNGKGNQKRRRAELPKKYGKSGNLLPIPGSWEVTAVMKKLPNQYRNAFLKNIKKKYDAGLFKQPHMADAAMPDSA